MTFDELAAKIRTAWKNPTPGQVKPPQIPALRPPVNAPSPALCPQPKEGTSCRYADRASELAFPSAPCRGKRVTCTHPDNSGMASFDKACQSGKCALFETS